MKESRSPINLRIKFRSESIDQFIDRYSIDVSRGGIFIRTREPLAVGTQLKFDFQLQDSSPLMAGEGTVVWIREYDVNRTGITPGMGVRFDKLTPASQPVLEKILAEKGRRDQSGASSGGIMSKVGAGIAVRRPSSTFTALDPRALGLPARTETPAVGTQAPDPARRERRPSSPGAPAPSESTQPGHHPAAAPLSVATTAAERTNQGGFHGPSAPGGLPAPMTLPSSASAPRGRTPGPLSALETPGSGRIGGARTEVPSLVSRLSATRPNYEPPTPADIDKALDGLMGSGGAAPATTKPAGAGARQRGEGVPVSHDDAPSEPTKTGDALTDAFAAGLAREVNERAAAAAGSDTAAPVAEVESDAERTVATSAAEVAAIVGADAVSGELESTARDMPALDPASLAARAPGTAAPSLFLVKSEPAAAPEKADAGAGARSVAISATEQQLNDDAATRSSSAVPKDELVPDQKTPQPTVVASSAQSTTAAGTFTTAGASAAGAPATTGLRAAPSSTARTMSARPAKKKNGALLVVGGLVAVGAVVGVLVSRQSAPDRAPETAAAPKNEPAAEPALKPGENSMAAAPAAPAAPTTESAGGPKPAEATPPAPVAATAPAAPVAEATPPPPPAAPAANPAEPPPTEEHADKPAAPAGKPAPEHKTVLVVGPPRRSQASAPAPSEAAGTAPAAEKPPRQHLLKITSSPAGAEVLIDGQSVGSTPYTAKEIDAESPHAVSVRLEGYEPHEHMISASDWTKQKGNLEIAKVSVRLRKLTPATPAPPTEPAPAKIEGTPAEPPPAEARTEPKTEPAPPATPPAEKAAAEPTAPAAVEPPPKPKDEPATAPPPAK
ncbi:MAG TPA: TIGR02266 family protein [Polyangia bacterium]|nr:TIGR02266 family protein [Polyangia bacterium]